MNQLEDRSEKIEAFIAGRYLAGLVKNGGIRILLIHYAIVVFFILVFWSPAMNQAIPHPEILMKLLGAFSFLVGTLAIPLTANDLFPSPADTDPAFETTPLSRTVLFDARLRVVLISSAAILFPIVPIFITFDLLTGRAFDPYDFIPFFIGIVSAIWVYFLMEIVSAKGNRSVGTARRYSLIATFILLHIGLVGLLARLARQFLQRADLIKLLIDLNPFSQFYILMEPPEQTKWLLVGTPLLRHVDYRLYLLVLMIIIVVFTISFYRVITRQRDDES